MKTMKNILNHFNPIKFNLKNDGSGKRRLV